MKLTRVMRSVSSLDGSRVADSLRKMRVRTERGDCDECDDEHVANGKVHAASGSAYGSRVRVHAAGSSEGSDERFQGAVERGSISGLRARGGGSSRNLSAIAAAQCIQVNGESADYAIDAEDGQPQPTLRASNNLRMVSASTGHSPVRVDRFTYTQNAQQPLPPSAAPQKKQWRVVRDFAARRDDELDLRFDSIGAYLGALETAYFIPHGCTFSYS